MSLFAELRRRNVFRVAVAYGVIAWVLAQVADLAFDNFGAPDWVSKSVLFVLMLGLPLAVFFAWAFELTPEGIKRERDVDREESITPETGRKLNRLIIGVLILAVGFLLWERTGNDEPPAVGEVVATDSSKLSIAVLPFDNRSNREEDLFFTEGIHDDLLTTMANIGSMKVISRTSVMEYRDTTKKIPEIAQELGVANILEGGIQRAGNQVRINVQLIDAETDEHLWAEIYDRRLSAENLFAIQSEVSKAIATALHATLSPDEQRRIDAVPTENLEAYEAYLLGRQKWEARTADSTAESVDLFKRAIELDPSFAEAWAGLGDAYRHQVPYGGLPESEVFPKAENAIRRALEQNNQLAEAHAAFGGLLQQQSRDWDLSIEHLRKALELNPSYSPAHNWLGVSYSATRQFEEAYDAFLNGLEIDPLSSILNSNAAAVAGWLGRDQEARERHEFIIRIRPETVFGYRGLADYYEYTEGRYDLATKWRMQAAKVDPNNAFGRTELARMYISLNEPEMAKQWLQSAAELQPGSFQVALGRMNLLLSQGDIRGAAGTAAGIEREIPDYPPDELLLSLLAWNDAANGNDAKARARYEEYLPDAFVDGGAGISFSGSAVVPDIVMILRRMGDDASADELLANLTRVAESIPAIGLSGVGFVRASAYALAGRREDALTALRDAIDEGARAEWWIEFAYNPALDSIRDDPRFMSMRDELVDDMAKQIDNLRRMEASSELPVVPGMNPTAKPEKTGPPPT